MAKVERKPRRLKVLHIDRAFILELLIGLHKGDSLQIPDFSECLPPKVRILDVQHNYIRNAFCFLLESEDFEPVPEGMLTPAYTEQVDYKMRVFNLATAVEQKEAE